MKLDIEEFKKLTEDEKKRKKMQLVELYDRKIMELEAVELKIKAAMADDDSKLPDLGQILSYRGGIVAELKEIDTSLHIIERFYKGEKVKDFDPGKIASTISGAGVVNIRPDDTKFRRAEGAKTYGEIMGDGEKGKRPKDRPNPRIAEIEEPLKSLSTNKIK